MGVTLKKHVEMAAIYYKFLLPNQDVPMEKKRFLSLFLLVSFAVLLVLNLEFAW